ncbi:hypothetical protein ACFX15_000691 [Malus domestica]|uniref:WRKY domain-containing protein n=1 Tax=Malus domestica TaxID=3750 RepID=A0A498KK13_MALDO|nr:hypothetical protein DVH24_009827 [Malus domestica]
MEDDWDLQAVVRGCSTATATTTTSSTRTPSTAATASFNISGFHSNPAAASFSSFGPTSPQQQLLFSLPLPDPIIKPRNAIEELHELYKPFFPKSQPSLSSPQITPPTLSPLTSLSPLTTPKDPRHPIHQQQQTQHSKPSSSTTTVRSKKRKNQLKKVCQVPAEALSSDIWAWRKYGQKPIKGSPYPRGYYRCSSSKGCMARKQVERNRSDPNMFIVTYTGEHNHPAPTHRNSLAGSTRQKPFSPQTATRGDSAKPASPTTSASADEEPEPVVAPQSTTVESSCKEEKGSPLITDEEDELLGMCDSVVSDDFFVGLDGLAGDYFSDHSTGSFGMPWISSSAATAAGSI